MGGPLSVRFSDIYMTKTDRKVVEPTKLQFYKRFVDDIINKRYKDQPDNLFQALYSNHPKIKYTIGVDHDKFLDTKIIQENSIATTEVNLEDRKLPVHWTSRIPKRYKRNSITSDLNRALRISSYLNDKISKMRQKLLNADYPLWFINSVIKQFSDELSEKSNEEDDYILPPDFFEIKKQLILIEVPHCEKNETSSKRFLKKFHELTNDSYEIKIKLITKKMRNLFRLKSKNPHPAWAMQEGVCPCKKNYIGETKRNVEIRGKNIQRLTKYLNHLDI